LVPFGVGIIAEKSAPDNADGRQTLLENGVYDRLNALGVLMPSIAYIRLKGILGAF
jgi:hypothetical protein